MNTNTCHGSIRHEPVDRDWITK